MYNTLENQEENFGVMYQILNNLRALYKEFARMFSFLFQPQTSADH
jgi:hypothetical protein